MNGLKRYCAKLLIIYILFTNTVPTTVFASQLSAQDIQQSMGQSQSGTDGTQSLSAPAPSYQSIAAPVALPQTATKFTGGASLLSITNTDGTAVSAHKRVGVRVQKLLKHDFKADEDVTLTLDNPDQEKYKTKVTDASGKDANVQFEAVTPSAGSGSSTSELQIIPTSQFTPGKYTLSVTDETGQTTKQDFTWGVLALNPDRVVYQPNTTADLSMAVLDDKGAMVCNAQVDLEIREQGTGNGETLSTDNKKITVNPECSSHAFTLKPDYEAQYQLGGVGSYDLILTAKTGSGTRSISQTISVQNSTPFDIQRVSATRIYPPNSYPMQINVTANRDFKGTITETVPDSFAITPADSHTSYDGLKTVYMDGNDPSAAVSKQVLGSATGGLVMPFDGNYPITQGFGAQLTDPTLQSLYTHFGLGGHDGIDFGVPMGTPLYAVADGKVTWSGPGDYGTQVIIKHTWGQTYYGHMSKTSVNVGDDIHKGSLIGYSGMSGEATGPHLHFGMKPNNPDMGNGYAGKIDPMPYLPIGSGQQGTAIRDLINQSGLPDVLGASTSADASPSAASPVPTIVPSFTPTPTITASDSASATTPANFTIDDAISQQSAEDQPQTMAETKVIKWHVDLKKGDKIAISYNFKTPQISPQFYLLGSLKFYNEKTSILTFDEGRQWQIAADDIGTGWYHPSVNPNSGYEWPYRKKLTIDHTQVGLVAGPPVLDHTSTFNNTGTTLNWSHQTSVTPGNSILVVAIGNDALSTTAAVSSVTYNGTALSQIPGAHKSNGTGGTGVAEIWYMLNPPVQTANIVVTVNSGVALVGGAATFSNVNQTTPFGTVATNSGSSSTASLSVGSTNTNQVIIEGQGNNAGTPTASGGQTLIGRNGGGAASYKAASSGTTAISWSLSGSGPWAEVGVAINGASVGHDEGNFPVLVNLTSDANLSAHAQSNGNDILFTDSGGENILSSEIDYYNAGTLVAWVKIPVLSSSTDTDIYMYYGNGSAASQSQTSTWDSNFRMVQHLGTKFRGAAQACPTFNDSTSNTFNLTCSGSPTNVTAQIEQGLNLSGSAQSLTGSTSVDDSITNQFTLSAWFFTTNVDGNPHAILTDNWVTGSKGIIMRVNSNKLAGGFKGTGTGTFVGVTPVATAGGAWTYGAMVYNGSTMTLYVNGTQDFTQAFAGGSVTTTTDPFMVGIDNGTNLFQGKLDELRVSDTARSADWISTEYANQSNPGSFVSVNGTEETKIYSATPAQYMRHGKFFDTTNNLGKQPFMF